MQNSRVTAQTHPLYSKTYRHKLKDCERKKPIILGFSAPQFPLNYARSVYYIILNILPNAKFNFIDYCPKTVIL